ncbi:MAG: sensor histidine kinase KdpD [Limnochordales bacterium]|nr:sensor histidine kinase KdpD [Limnochordales bacterium]
MVRQVERVSEPGPTVQPSRPASSRIDPQRPDPDALLARIAEKEGPPRGRLTIFLGAAAGVGKTYAMLEAAQQRLAEGVDVVAGWVETHGRRETEAMLAKIPRLPPRSIPYRGTVLQEMDLDALLARHPQLALVDELAHTNAPGCRHARRYQDVEELLQAGISVYTTLNVQHIESLNDVVAQITGVVVRETVPDYIVDEADQINLVDLPPEELIQRLKEGKVYVPQQAEQALRHFFRPGNLNALRELALRRTAAHVDKQLRRYMHTHEIPGPWPAGERVLVCVSPSPLSAQLVRAARRMAAGLQAEWLAVYVERPQAKLSPEDRRRVAATLRLAEQLGAEVITLHGDNVADEIVHLAHTRNVTQIVIGKPDRPRWQEWLHGSPVDEIIRKSGAINVHIIKGEGLTPHVAPLPAVGEPAASGQGIGVNRPSTTARSEGSGLTPIGDGHQLPPAAPAVLKSPADLLSPQRSIPVQPTGTGHQANMLRFRGLSYLVSLALVALVTVIGHWVREFMDPVNLASAYLLPILWSGMRYGSGPAVVAAFASVLALDFFFIKPYYTLQMAETRYLFTLLVFLGVGLMTSTLGVRLRRQVEHARQREATLAALYGLSREAVSLTTTDEVSEAVIRRVQDALGGEALLLLPDQSGHLQLKRKGASHPPSLPDNELAVAEWVYAHGQPAGLDTETLAEASALYLPLTTARGVVGVLGLRPATAFGPEDSNGPAPASSLLPKGRGRGPVFSPEQRHLLEAMAGLAATAIERVQLSEAAQSAQLLAESDRLRTALLNSVSHELRTPLASVIGSVTTLLEDEHMYDPKARRDLLETIREEALRMNRLVGNLLDMARLESGRLQLDRDACDLQEVVAGALARLKDELEPRPFTVTIPDDLPPVLIDPGLIEQVLVNLLDNAVKYSPSGSAIEVSAAVDQQHPTHVRVTVGDYGPGIPPEDLERIFERFYRLKRPGQAVGTGLGLSICRGIVEAHGGRIWAENRAIPEEATASGSPPRSGTLVHFTVPIAPQPLSPPLPILGGGPEKGD